MLQSHKNIALGASILLLTVCVHEIMNMAGRHGKHVDYVMGQSIFALHWQKVNKHSCTLLSSDLQQKQNKNKKTSIA